MADKILKGSGSADERFFILRIQNDNGVGFAINVNGVYYSGISYVRMNHLNFLFIILQQTINNVVNVSVVYPLCASQNALLREAELFGDCLAFVVFCCDSDFYAV